MYDRHRQPSHPSLGSQSVGLAGKAPSGKRPNNPSEDVEPADAHATRVNRYLRWHCPTVLPESCTLGLTRGRIAISRPPCCIQLYYSVRCSTMSNRLAILAVSCICTGQGRHSMIVNRVKLLLYGKYPKSPTSRSRRKKTEPGIPSTALVFLLDPYAACNFCFHLSQPRIPETSHEPQCAKPT